MVIEKQLNQFLAGRSVQLRNVPMTIDGIKEREERAGRMKCSCNTCTTPSLHYSPSRSRSRRTDQSRRPPHDAMQMILRQVRVNVGYGETASARTDRLRGSSLSRIRWACMIDSGLRT